MAKYSQICKFCFRFYFGIYIDPRCFLGFVVNIPFFFIYLFFSFSFTVLLIFLCKLWVLVVTHRILVGLCRVFWCDERTL